MLQPRNGDAAAGDQVFWLITGLISAWLLGTIGVDLMLLDHVLQPGTLPFALIVFSIVLTLIWIAAPLILRERFPRWAGALGYGLGMTVLASTFFTNTAPFYAASTLHILPVLALYVGWFWRQRIAVLMFGISFSLLTIVVLSCSSTDHLGVLNLTVSLYALLIMLLAFVLALVLKANLSLAANTDSLTGTLNVRGITAKLRRELARAERQGEPLSVVVTDFDEFKQLNDVHGHSYGDEVLRKVTQQWLANIRLYDVVGRIGGDEFVLIFPQTTLTQAEHVLERLQRIPAHPWSYGVVQAEPGETAEAVVLRADEQLYEQKRKRHLRPTPTSQQQTRLQAQQLRVLPRRRRRQSAFSVMSATLSVLMSIPLYIELLVANGGIGTHNLWLLSLAIVAPLVGAAVPLANGDRYPFSTASWTVFLWLSVYVAVAFIKQPSGTDIALIYGTTLLAIYLGIFSGSSLSRGLMMAGLLLMSVPIMRESLIFGSPSQQVITTSVLVYAVIVNFILFELGSYLYNRSRILIEHDGLTGVLNRYGLHEYGERELSRAERGGYALSVVMLDCIGFKQINDQHGHAAGDRMLVAVAEHLAARISPDDLLVRSGGDEFMLILPYCTASQAQEQVQRILVGAPNPMRVGIAEHQPGESQAELIRRADARLLAAKSA